MPDETYYGILLFYKRADVRGLRGIAWDCRKIIVIYWYFGDVMYAGSDDMTFGERVFDECLARPTVRGDYCDAHALHQSGYRYSSCRGK